LGCQGILEIANIPQFIAPKPSLIFRELIDEWPWLLSHLRITLYEATAGFLLGVAVAIPLALSYHFVPSLEPIIVPMAVATINIPFVAIAPILFIVLGYGPSAKILIVALLTFFPVMSNLAAGFNSVDLNLRERLFVLHASRWQVFTKLELPSSIPYLVAGLTIAVSNSVIGAIVGELLGTTKGMGFVVLTTVSQYKMPLLLAAVILITITSIGLNWLVRASTQLIFRHWLINQ
jgi:NitT/TauT family transport system permease protein